MRSGLFRPATLNGQLPPLQDGSIRSGDDLPRTPNGMSARWPKWHDARLPEMLIISAGRANTDVPRAGSLARCHDSAARVCYAARIKRPLKTSPALPAAGLFPVGRPFAKLPRRARRAIPQQAVPRPIGDFEANVRCGPL